MPCTHVRLPGGGSAIVCGPKQRRRRCKACGSMAEPRNLRECDWKIGAGKTCDLLICAGCSTSVGPDKDLCPAHAAIWEKHPKNPILTNRTDHGTA